MPIPWHISRSFTEPSSHTYKAHDSRAEQPGGARQWYYRSVYDIAAQYAYARKSIPCAGRTGRAKAQIHRAHEGKGGIRPEKILREE